MRFKATWILLIIAVLAAGYLFIIEQPKHAREQRDAAAQLRLADIEIDSIARVVIEPAGERTIEIDKRDGAWKLTAPIADNADEATVNTLVASIANARIERILESDPALPDEFGLNETATRIVLMTAGGDTALTLIIGAYTLTKSDFYARKNAHSDILLLPTTIRRYAVKDLSDFRDKRVVTYPLEDVTKYRLASDSKAITWELLPDRGWITVQEGDTIRGDRTEVDAILRTLKALRVRSFVSDNPADFDRYWGPPHDTISIWTTGSAEPIVVRCGRAGEGEFYAKRDDADRIVKLDGIFLASFDKTVDDLRDKRLLSFTRERVATIFFQSPDTSGALVRSGSGWAFPNPTLGLIDESAMTSLFAGLELLKFDSVVKNKALAAGNRGFDSPSYTIELLDTNGERIDLMRAGVREPGTGERYVTSVSSGVIALIDEQKLGGIMATFKGIAAR